MKSFYYKQPCADEQVRATISGQKTLMVLPVKVQPNTDQHIISKIVCSTDRKENGMFRWVTTNEEKTRILDSSECFSRPFNIGERYWLKESFRYFDHIDECGASDYCSCPPSGTPLYRASHDDGESKWQSSIHMPQHASRCTIEIKRVYVKRAQEMTQEENDQFSFANGGINYQWRYNLDFWDSNPWCWFVEFEVVK